jgi:hypothetical protein
MKFPDDGEKFVTDNREEDTRNINNAVSCDRIKAINGMVTSNSQDSDKNHFFVTQVMLPSAIVGVQLRLIRLQGLQLYAVHLRSARSHACIRPLIRTTVDRPKTLRLQTRLGHHRPGSDIARAPS